MKALLLPMTCMLLCAFCVNFNFVLWGGGVCVCVCVNPCPCVYVSVYVSFSIPARS